MGDSRPPGIPPDAQETVLPTSSSATPTMLFGNRYRIERIIGEGAFGRVYLAMDTRLRRNVAIKELLASRNTTDHATYERYLERFQREARATGMVQQSNVVTVYDLHVDETGNNYLVMEYVDGTNLRDLLAQVGTLPYGRAIAITTDVARALEAVHEQEIVHRDIKPANIMITRRGVAKLMDFGIAQVGHESLRTQVASGHPGTPIYMSPEQSSGYGYIDGRSDLYSLGLVLYEMLAGEPYARRRQPLGTLRSDLPPQVVAVVDRALARDVDARYQSATDFIKDLEALGTATPPATDAYALADADQTRPALPPTPTWPIGAGAIAPPGGVPSAYGGSTSQGVAGAPVYPPTAPGTRSEGYAPPYDLPPSGPPARRGNKGALFAIGGVLIAVLAVAGYFIFANPNTPTPVPTATIAPTAAPTSVPTTRPTTIPTATTVATPVPTATTAPTISPTIAPTTAPTGPAGGLTTFTDPSNLIRLRYPAGWKPTKLADDATNVLELDGPDNVFFFVYINDPQQGSITDEIQIIKKNEDTSMTFTYSNQQFTDTTIGGELAKAMSYTFLSKSDATNTGPGQWWVTNHGGKQFSFRSNFPGSHQAELDAILGSVAFGNNGVFVNPNSWKDPKGLVQLEYPAGWTPTTDPSVKANVLELDGPDNTFFYVSIYDPQTSAVLNEEIADIRNVHAKDTQYTYTDGPVVDASIGGEPARTFPYTAKSKTSGATFTGQVWEVNHSGKEYLISANGSSAHKAEIDTIIASITFQK